MLQTESTKQQFGVRICKLHKSDEMLDSQDRHSFLIHIILLVKISSVQFPNSIFLSHGFSSLKPNSC